MSEGCRHCYAERQAVRQREGRYAGLVRSTPSGPRWTGAVQLVTEQLDAPLRWKKPQRVFVNSMSDLFHEALPDEAIDDVFAVMACAPHLTFQVLTKRAARMRDWAARSNVARVMDAAVLRLLERIACGSFDIGPVTCFVQEDGVEGWPLPNVWLGVSVEDQKTADERVPLLLETPAAVRFVSYEPALGPVAFNREWLGQGSYCATCAWWNCPVDEAGCCTTCGGDALWHGVDWVIVGGESGPGARPFDVAWARSALKQCREAATACFIKQLGARPWEPVEGVGPMPMHLRHPKGGDQAEWPEDLRVREFPA